MRSSSGFHLTREQVVSVIGFAARSLDAPPLCPHPLLTLMLILFDNGTLPGVTAAVNAATPGSFIEVEIPFN